MRKLSPLCRLTKLTFPFLSPVEPPREVLPGRRLGARVYEVARHVASGFAQLHAFAGAHPTVAHFFYDQLPHLTGIDSDAHIRGAARAAHKPSR